MAKMKCDLRDRWTANLRSGVFIQATGHLEIDAGFEKHAYCCLGVLCITAGVPLGHDPDGGEYLPPLGYRHPDRPNQALINPEPFGLTEEQVDDLWRMNDGMRGRRCSFPEIADWIDNNVECE